MLILAAAAMLPGIGRLLRRTPHRRCALDGAEVDPAIMVELATPGGESLQFCSLFCAERWLEASGERPLSIRVTDEVSGEPIDAADAFFVRSLVIAHEPTGERRHVFRRRDDAQQHAEEHYGHILEEEERPFARWLQ